VPVYFRKDFFGIDSVRLQRLFAVDASSQDILLYQRTDRLLLTDGQIIQSLAGRVNIS
jgi:hypothetical protein